MVSQSHLPLIAGDSVSMQTIVKRPRRCSQDRQGGFSMLEVLVALTVITVGMLGVAVMQQFAIARNVDAKELTMATNLAAEMMDRIQYSHKNVASYNGIDVSSASATCPVVPQMTVGDCTQWRTRLVASKLPGVRGTVAVSTTGPASLNQWLVTVQIRWSNLSLPITFSSVVSLG